LNWDELGLLPKFRIAGVIIHRLVAVLRWKPQRIKIHRLGYRFFFDFLIHALWVLFWKSQTFGKSLETFGLQIFFLRFFKSIGWYGFWVVLNLFHQNISKTNKEKSHD
jgi:hypothetical protein